MYMLYTSVNLKLTNAQNANVKSRNIVSVLLGRNEVKRDHALQRSKFNLYIGRYTRLPLTKWSKFIEIL
jgi:hypothetical protein